MNKVELAKRISKYCHRGAKYGSHDYFDYHIMNVINDCLLAKGSDERIKDILIVAALHDAHEDTNFPLWIVRVLFGKKIRDAVDAISHRKSEGEPRSDYYDRIEKNELARIVKYFDARENYSNCMLDSNDGRSEYYWKILSRFRRYI